MNIVYAIPVAEPPIAANPQLHKWKDQGYVTAIQIDAENPHAEVDYVADYTLRRTYQGYPEAISYLAFHLLTFNKTLDIVVTGGTDIDPAPTYTAEQIGQQFMQHFPDTFGVMQPTGDPWMLDERGVPAAARICGSPWMGRAFIKRINRGRGPFWPDYWHFYCDEEMKEVTEKLGILWQRPDLVQYHHHWSREGGRRPEFLNKARANWAEAKALFNSRKAAGFPGHEPLPA